MIFERSNEDEYKRWFAWRPVILYGPEEWDREKMTGSYPRVVWLCWVWRMRHRPRTYYALGDYWEAERQAEEHKEPYKHDPAV